MSYATATPHNLHSLQSEAARRGSVIYTYAVTGELRRRCKGPITLIDTPYPIWTAIRLAMRECELCTDAEICRRLSRGNFRICRGGPLFRVNEAGRSRVH